MIDLLKNLIDGFALGVESTFPLLKGIAQFALEHPKGSLMFLAYAIISLKLK